MVITSEKLCDLLRLLLEGKNIAKTAKEAGITQAYLWKIVSKKADPQKANPDVSAYRLSQILDVLGFNMSDVYKYLEIQLPLENIVVQLNAEKWDREKLALDTSGGQIGNGSGSHANRF